MPEARASWLRWRFASFAAYVNDPQGWTAKELVDELTARPARVVGFDFPLCVLRALTLLVVASYPFTCCGKLASASPAHAFQTGVGLSAKSVRSYAEHVILYGPHTHDVQGS